MADAAAWRVLRVTRAGAPGTPARVDLETTDRFDPVTSDGDVVVDVEFSSINYKDGMALAGRSGIIKADSLIPGIDLVGTVVESESERWKAGDAVILNGWGIGETHDGGLAERARVRSEWLVRRPESISAKRAAAIGTAGYTAALAIAELERGTTAGAGVDRAGPILVTGAAGGVGSIAIALLARRGYEVTAATGRLEHTDYLKRLGATDVINRAELAAPGNPLQSQRFGGAIDSAGGRTLANVLAQTHYRGTVVSCGLADSLELPTTVLPFILRAITLVGVNSVNAPPSERDAAWSMLSADLDLALLDLLTETVPLAGARDAAERILSGRVRGRLVVDTHSQG